jgi:hypothetical protein
MVGHTRPHRAPVVGVIPWISRRVRALACCLVLLCVDGERPAADIGKQQCDRGASDPRGPRPMASGKAAIREHAAWALNRLA